MPRKIESRLQREIRSALEKHVGGVWTKIHGGEFQEPGIADLLGCVCGMHIEVEVKTDDGDLRPTQLLRRWRIKTVGEGAFLVARSTEEAVDKVARYLRKHGKIPKNLSAGLPGKRVVIPPRAKNRCVVHAAKDGENAYFLPRARAVVVKRR